MASESGGYSKIEWKGEKMMPTGWRRVATYLRFATEYVEQGIRTGIPGSVSKLYLDIREVQYT